MVLLKEYVLSLKEKQQHIGSPIFKLPQVRYIFYDLPLNIICDDLRIWLLV